MNKLNSFDICFTFQVGELLGHEDRILHISLSPDQQTVVSAAADETLRFWRCFPLLAGPGDRARNSASHNGSYLNSSNQTTGEECVTPDFSMLRYIRWRNLCTCLLVPARSHMINTNAHKNQGMYISMHNYYAPPTHTNLWQRRILLWSIHSPFLLNMYNSTSALKQEKRLLQWKLYTGSFFHFLFNVTHKYHDHMDYFSLNIIIVLLSPNVMNTLKNTLYMHLLIIDRSNNIIIWMLAMISDLK